MTILIGLLFLTLAACDSTGLNSEGDVTSAAPVVAYAHTKSRVKDFDRGTYGCEGVVWSEDRRMYGAFAIEIDLPHNMVREAEGSVYRPEFELKDGDHLVMSAFCSLPNVKNNKAMKAHDYVSELLANSVTDIVSIAHFDTIPGSESSARVELNSFEFNDDDINSTGFVSDAGYWRLASTSFSSASGCRIVAVAFGSWRGVAVTVYDLSCSGGAPPGRPGGGDMGEDYGVPSECFSQFVPSDECRQAVNDIWPNPNIRERQLCDQYFFECAGVAVAYVRAEAYEAGMDIQYRDLGPFPDWPLDSSPINARKHAYYAANVAALLGSASRGRVWTDAHEYPYAAFDISNPHITNMDFYNNEIGLAIGLGHSWSSSPSDIVRDVQDAALDVRLRVWPCGPFPGVEGLDVDGGFCRPGEGPSGDPGSLTAPERELVSAALTS